MPISINPMEKQASYDKGKVAFVAGKRRGDNPYRWRNKELASFWSLGSDQAKKDSTHKIQPDHLSLTLE